jgi:hypothetical protein
VSAAPNHQEVAFERRDGGSFSGALPGNREPRIVVTAHAYDRASCRFPDLEPAAIEGEVAGAFAEGRVRRPRPRWLGLSRTRVRTDTRYVWPPGCHRAYVVRLVGGLVVVVTVLARQRAALEAA